MSIKLALGVISEISDAAFRALEMTGDALRTEVIDAQVMPFNNGDMQNNQTSVDSDLATGTVRIVTNAPQAQRLYIHPEYNFQRGNNTHAQGEWYEPWIHGERKDQVAEIYAAMLREELG